jgi:hypothetical protein
MKCRAFLTIIVGLLLGLVSIVHAEPKAYELVKYRGKAGAVTVAFDYADGYSEGSEVRTIQDGRTTNFRIDSVDTGSLAFVLVKGTGKSVTVKIDTEQPAPNKVTGTYTSGGKSTTFTLTKGK